MALEKSRPSDSNVLNLDEARRKRDHESNVDAFNDESLTSTNCRNAGDRSPEIPKTSETSNRRFNKVKVDAIKAAMAKGEYQINFLRVADKFIEHERYS